MGTGHESEQEQENYSFIQESIKEEKINSQKILRTIGLGLLFGLAACLGFFALKPWAESIFQKQPNKVEIPEDDEKENIEVENPDGETEPIIQELTLENYLQLNEALQEVSREIEKSVVYLYGISQDESWGDIWDENTGGAFRSAGVIVEDNGRELLILSNYSSMKQAQLFRVKFADGSEHEDVLKQKDANADIAVFSVAKIGISDGTMNKIKIVSMGNSNIVEQGDGLIAAGSPFGVEDGLGYGIASTVDYTINSADRTYEVIVSDMPWVENASGVIFDVYGRLVGMIDAKLYEEDRVKTLAMIGISSIKEEIELMSNGKNVPYIGIEGITITAELSERYGIPEGLFVESVTADSPAMKAGIQAGDVITEVAGERIDSFPGYYNIIIDQEPGKAIKMEGKRQGTDSYVDIDFNVTVGIKE